MSDTIFFSWNEIQSVTKGEWLLKPTTPGATCVLDDSRKIVPGALFMAIVGELADGHNYVESAARAGAGCVCVQRPLKQETMTLLESIGCGCLLVPDSLAAFQAISNANRRRYPKLPVLAVTGSCGKTSTKEMGAAVLSARWPGQVLKTEGNTNNHFGVPRNLLRINGETKAAVIEAGSNHPGEIAALGRIIEPVSSVITCIGAAHLEFFKDFNGVAEEKGDILEASSPEGVAIIPADCVGLDILKRHAGSRRIVTFGLSDKADVQAIYGGMVEGGYRLTIIRHDTGEKASFVWPIGGEAQAGNASAAAAAGIAFGLSLKEIAEGLKNCSLPGARMAQTEIGGVHWVNDAYNANPSSMAASLKWFQEVSKDAPRRYVVIGDMLELGETSSQNHRETLEIALQMFAKPTDKVITVGPIFAAHSRELGVECYGNVQEAASRKYEEGSWVFLKASCGTGLYKLVPAK